MKQALVVLSALVFACSSLALAQDDAAKKAKMEDKHALKSVTCDPACGFAVKGHDESEIVSIVQMHAKKQHNMDMSEADVKKMVKEEMMEKKEVKKDVKMEVKTEGKDKTKKE